jgi:mono/diheme cytochrome c family protein
MTFSRFLAVLGRSAGLLAILFWLTLPLSSQAQPNGAELFANNCASCHKIHEDLVGPALKGIEQRRDEAWLLKWIRNPQAVIASGDPYAVKLYEKWNKAQMTAYASWSDAEIKSVLAYIKEEGAKAPVAAAAPAGGTGADGSEAGAAGGFTTLTLWIVLGASGIIILLLSLLQRQYRMLYEERVASGRISETELKQFNLALRLKPLHLVGGGLTLILVSGVGWGVDMAQHIGIQQGYQPTQPVAFSHELHAGAHEIACTYCHTGAERGKSATIPAVNVCMNCHNQIKKESPEIKKIWTAYETNTPIQWVRIHNLPDFGYFNHYQHYKVAGIQCQTCHGPIETMPEVYQHSQLTMGWCINCHRETKVNLDNGYYQQVHGNSKAFVQAVSDKGLTIANLGGLDCAKCHY